MTPTAFSMGLFGMYDGKQSMLPSGLSHWNWVVDCTTGRKIKYILWWQYGALLVWLLGQIRARLCGFTSERHLKFFIWIDKLFNLQHELTTINFYG